MIGPGGCKGKEACYAYCSSPDNVDECITFAGSKGLMSGDKLEKIKGKAEKVKAALAKGIKPPACASPKECASYCKETEHMEECINFSIEAGIMDEQEQEKVEKVLSAIKKGIKPPACNGKEECDTYCKSVDHMEECMNFAIEAGMMSEEEQDKALKTLEAINNGITPLNCKGEEECKAYCSEEGNMEECIKFGEATGRIKEGDADMIRKTGGRGTGPGNGAGQGLGGPGDGNGPGNGEGQGLGGPGDGTGPGN